jgi:LysM repeat protein
MRLTRLGRLVVSVGALVLLACVALSVAAASAGTSAPAAPSRSVTVRAGQTLSEIAVTQLPRLPMDVAVTRIQLANGLSTSQVLAGQVLLVPGS